MRVFALGLAAVLLAVASPASAAWNSYISHPLGISFEAPGSLKVERGAYQATVAGKHDTLVFTASEDGIEYRVTVIDMGADANKSASILGEAAYNFQDGKKLLMDTYGRVDRQYGRKLSVDLPNKGGRAAAAYYFLNGKLLELRATAAPGADFDSPDISRFIDSVAFFTVRARPESIEIALPK